jgi:hypothetical protein
MRYKVSSRAELGMNDTSVRSLGAEPSTTTERPRPPNSFEPRRPLEHGACLDYTPTSTFIISSTTVWTPQDSPRRLGLYYTKTPLLRCYLFYLLLILLRPASLLPLSSPVLALPLSAISALQSALEPPAPTAFRPNPATFASIIVPCHRVDHAATLPPPNFP